MYVASCSIHMWTLRTRNAWSMERVKRNRTWTLFDPRDIPIQAGYLGTRIIESQIETGDHLCCIGTQLIVKNFLRFNHPFLSKITDKNNQKKPGTTTHSNVCTEIMQYSSDEETAICILASIGLPTSVQPDKSFDFSKLYDVSMIILWNLNLIIDSGQHVNAKAQLSNQRHQAIGVGIQGLADKFMAMGVPFESTNAKELNLHISQMIYHACLTASNTWARDKGSYSSFKGLPASLGVLQFDMWEVTPPSYRLDWELLWENIIADGFANSLMIVLMPTAGTTQITGFSESFAPLHRYHFGTPSNNFVAYHTHWLQQCFHMMSSIRWKPNHMPTTCVWSGIHRPVVQ